MSEKLVRDRIPEIIRRNGEVAITRRAKKEEYRDFLKAKLLEEVQEFMETKTRSEATEEMADILEVLEAIYLEWQLDRTTLRVRKDKKALEKGNFSQHIILEIEDKQDKSDS